MLAVRQQRFRPVARIVPNQFAGLSLAEVYAHRLATDRSRIRSAIQAPLWSDCQANRADFSAVASTNVEASLLGGNNEQPFIPRGFFNGAQGYSRSFSLFARGAFSTTGAPSLTFQARMSNTVGSGTLSGASLGVSSAITCGSGVTNKMWELGLDIICFTPGQGTGNTTLCSAGYVASQGFGTAGRYPLEVTTPDTATWTQTFDSTLEYYLNLSVTWSVNSASNSIVLKQLLFRCNN